MTKYSSSGVRNCGRDAINEFKLLIREAHKQGIEVAINCNMVKHLVSFFPFFGEV